MNRAQVINPHFTSFTFSCIKSSFLSAIGVHFLALFGMMESTRAFEAQKALLLLLYTAKDTQ
jgi:hypothetical protein